jgi:hypothetical protein
VTALAKPDVVSPSGGPPTEEVLDYMFDLDYRMLRGALSHEQRNSVNAWVEPDRIWLGP